jgi:hypothetical protein
METFSAGRRITLSSMIQQLSITRMAFIAAALFGGTIFWLANRPPMADLPQHAGQIAAFHDLLVGDSPWKAILKINLFTPYLIGYASATALSFFMPIVDAMKLLLTLSYYAFVLMCVLLRKRLGGDERLDWLFLPSYFGFSYEWGFFTFLMAAPVSLLYLLQSLKYSERPGFTAGVRLVAYGVVLFFSHGLMFIFSNIAGGLFLVIRRRPLAIFLRALIPYVSLGALCVLYVVVNPHANSVVSVTNFTVPGATYIGRLWNLLSYTWGDTLNYRRVLTLAVLAMTLLLGLRFNRARPAAFMPMLALLLYWFASPERAMNTDFIYQRFAIFLLPFFALLFAQGSAHTAPRWVTHFQAVAIQMVLAFVCVGFLAVQARRAMEFSVESEEFEQVLSAAQPAQKALMLVFDTSSSASGYVRPYMHYAAWYQAERQGLIDPNFAWFLPQIVRFQPGSMPKLRMEVGAEPLKFDWKQDHADQYRYFFVRNTAPLPAGLFNEARCPVHLVKSAGAWSLFENSCR